MEMPAGPRVYTLFICVHGRTYPPLTPQLHAAMFTAVVTAVFTPRPCESFTARPSNCSRSKKKKKKKKKKKRLL